MKNERQSGIELLRIISMVGVVVHHYKVWGGYNSAVEYPFCWQLVFNQILGLPGKISCAIFALITGYFLSTNRKSGWIYYRKICIVIAEMVFYYLVILIIFLITKAVPVSGKDILKSLLPPVYGTWYAVNYILVYLLAPYLNLLVRALSKKSYLALLMILMVIWCLIPTFFVPTIITTDVYDFGSLDFFLVMYLIGGYLRLYLKPSESNRRYLWGLLLSIASLVLSVIVFDVIGVKTGKTSFIANATWFRSYNSPIAIAISVFSLLYFSNLSFSNRFVNTISGSMLGVYLIHNNFILRRYIWKVLSPNFEHFFNPVGHALIKISLVFSLCVAVDRIRIRTVHRWFIGKCMPFIDRKGFQFEEYFNRNLLK